jgi:hypothetical protein
MMETVGTAQAPLPTLHFVEFRHPAASTPARWKAGRAAQRSM